MSRFTDRFGRFTPFAVYPSTLIVLALTAAAVISGHQRTAETIAWDATTVVALALSALPALCLFHLLHLGLGRHRAALVGAELGLLLFYAVLTLEHFSMRAAPDLLMIAPSPRAFLRRELLWIRDNGISQIVLLAIGVTLLVAVALELRWRVLSRWRVPRPRTGRAIAAATVYLAVLLVPWHNHDEVASFLRSALRHFAESTPSRLAAAGLPLDVPYPYQRRDEPIASPGERPYVFLIALESWNGGQVDARTEDGKVVTPTLNRLLRDGLYVERFYAPSTQTARGHLAILCSVLPGLWRKVFVAYPELELQCLPRILAAHGYRSTFFSGGNDLDYDNTRTAMRRLGFDEVRTVEGEPRGDHWGWGWQDDRLYREIFAMLDGEGRRLRRAPRFLFIPTIAHHFAFDAAPHSERRLYPDPRSFRQHYLNSLNMADRYLETFFAELARRPVLRDSIVVLVGDHGFPTRDRELGDPPNEVGAPDEAFRVPLLVLWPGRLQPRRLRDVACSQLDIAPTLLDLLGIFEPHHFVGRSLLRPLETGRVVPIMQPYDGLYLGAVRWPYKYLRRMRTGEERFLDLAADPGERSPLRASSPTERAALEALRRQLPVIYFNQRLLDTNRIWPRGR